MGIAPALDTTSTAATKRYPFPTTVSTHCGFSVESRRACRTLLIAMLTPVSTSTKTSFPQSRSAISASGHEPTAVLNEQDEQFHRLAFEPYRPALSAKLVGLDVQLEVPKAERLVRA